MTPTTWACSAACTTCPNSRPGPVRSTVACSILSGSARAASSRVQPLSGSRTRPPRWTGGGPRPCGSATLGSRPWPAPCAPACSPVTGLTNQSLRALMTGLLGEGYSMNRASYDLPRPRRNGLIPRAPGRTLYQLTTDGQAFAIFYTKAHNRVLRPLLATAAPQAPPPLRAALRTIDQQVNARFADARLPMSAA